MAAQGANIVFTDIDRERTVRLEEELRDQKMNAKGIVSDVSNPHAIDSLLRTLAQEQLSIDILVNNVGINGSSDTTHEVGADKWQTTFSTNVFGPMHLTQAIASGMQAKGGGSIIFITSMHQWVVRRIPSYSASKAALGMIIKELAVELAPSHIRVNGIAPGWVEEDDEGNTRVNHYSLLHRTSINPAYIGRAAVYLASDYFSKFTTGTILKIDDGLSLVNHLFSNQKAKS
jgi:NAD(P)-dependent dehydrogenase (short-subunit alcohol dehydrogenase family)